MAEAVAALSPRERTIVEARFLAEQPSTLDELAKIFRISRERIRQIEQRALQRIKTKISEALAHRGAALASSSDRLHRLPIGRGRSAAIADPKTQLTRCLWQITALAQFARRIEPISNPSFGRISSDAIPATRWRILSGVLLFRRRTGDCCRIAWR
ncbi:sigma factor-like helix-turn-helix DNA-binding protein [Bradyrhizobium sp. RDM4]|uniref:sigma factor-like helix-turn-helix DNA-binding protein n=1 Tax=Bradyrhizobium sp. RDM4 TaxID=3378765 RepID=UPI0038FD0D03